MDGRISVSSKVGEGSSFTVKIPEQKEISVTVEADHKKAEKNDQIAALLTQFDPESMDDSSSENQLGAEEAKQEETYRIMVIDDNTINTEVIKDILTGSGYPVDIAHDGVTGLKMMIEHPPDLLLLDLMMPKFSGEDVIYAMKQQPHLKNVPVILLTARASQEDRLLGLEMGADDYLAKPLLSKEMLLRVKNMLSRLDLARTKSEKKVLETTLATAQEVHESLGIESEQVPNVSLASFYESAELTGGDWFGMKFDRKNQRLYTMIGDVTGHGVPSALITVAAAGAVKATLTALEAQPYQIDMTTCLQQLADSVNVAVFGAGHNIQRNMTMAFTCIDLQSGEGSYLNAGHNGIFHIKKDKTTTIIKPGDTLGSRLNPTFGINQFTLKSDDLLVYYTDGLIENEGPNRETLNPRKLRRILGQTHPNDLKKKILSQGRLIWKNQKPEDDCSFLILQFNDFAKPINSEPIKKAV